MKFSVSSLIAVICFFTAVAAITDEQEAAIARLKLLMEKLSSIKRSPVFAEEKRGIICNPFAVHVGDWTDKWSTDGRPCPHRPKSNQSFSR